MKQLWLATTNKHKVEEFAQLFATDQIEIHTAAELEGDFEVEETGSTFAENALLKARGLATRVDGWVLADDSGLCVASLDDHPGIYSARFAGIGATDAANRSKLLASLQQESNRAARFVCALAVIDPSGAEYVYIGTCEGEITDTERGDAGFGYDSIFYVPHAAKTLAELTAAEKNRISHRAKAMKLLYAAHDVNN